MTYPLRAKRDTAANWTASNRVLLLGEFGYEYDTLKLKIGDGTTPWVSLGYVASGGGGGGSGNALTSNPLNQFAATSSAQLLSIMTDATGTNRLVFSNNATLVAPLLGTPAAIDLTNATNIPAGQITGVIPIANLATGTATGSKFIRDDGTLQVIPGGGDALQASPLSQFAATTSAQLAGVITNETGTGVIVFNNSPTLIAPALGTPASGVMTNVTGVPLGAIVNMASGMATFLGTSTSANLAATVTDETGTGSLVFATNPVLTTPNLGTPSALNAANITNVPITSLASLGSGVAAWMASPSSANLASAMTNETGTAGGLVFSVGPTISGLNTTGLCTSSGASVNLTNAMAGTVIDVTAGTNTKTISTDTTFSFSATPTTQSVFSLRLANSDSNPHVIGIPASFSNTRQVATTAFSMPAGTAIHIFWEWDGSTYFMYGETPPDGFVAEASIASAATTDLGSLSSINVQITGTTGISNLGTAGAGVFRQGRFASSLVLTNNATSLILNNGGSNITTAAGDRFSAYSLGSGNWLMNVTRASGASVSGGGSGDMVLASPQIVTGTKQFGTIGGAVGMLILAGSTSGSTVLNAAAIAGSTTVVLPGSSDTLVGRATTDTLTNKTLTTAVLNGTPSGTSLAIAATASTLVFRDSSANVFANAHIDGATFVTTAAGTTTLTVASTQQQIFTGSTTQTMVLPVASTLTLGQVYSVKNNSSGAITIQSSGTNTVATVGAGSNASFTVILTSGTTAASWFAVTPSAGAGTVTNAAALTSNQIVYGAGGNAVATAAGLAWDGTSQLILGVAGTSTGAISFRNGASGTLLLSAPSGALSSNTLTLPIATDTLVGKATTDTLTNKSIDAAQLTGTISVNRFNSGTGATSNAYLAGDGTWGVSIWKPMCLCATTANGTLASAYANGQTVDGITLTTGDRVLIKNQTTGSENGIYIVPASGTPTRSTDFDAWAEVIGAVVGVSRGTANGGRYFECSSIAGGTIGSTSISFGSFNGIANAAGKTLTNNNNLTLSAVDGKTLTVNNTLTFAGTDGTTITMPSVSSTVAQAGQTFGISFGIAGALANQDYTIALRMPFAGTITETSSISASGTATATFKVNTTALGGTANAVSSAQVNTTQSSANTFVANDLLKVTISANSSCTDASFGIKYTRTLA